MGIFGPQHQLLSKVRKRRPRAREGLIGEAVLGFEFCPRELEILRSWGGAEREGEVETDGAGVQSKRQ